MVSFLSWLGIFADAASIVGLVITGVVWIQVRGLKRDFLSRARLPQQVQQLRRHSAVLSRAYEQGRDATATLARLEGMLDNLKGKVPWEHRSKVKRLVQTCSEVRAQLRKRGAAGDSTKQAIWEIYLQLEELIVLLEQVVKDREWS